MGNDLKPRIVLSGVNFVEGGPLAIFQDALRGAVAYSAGRYEVVALVHRRELFDIAGVEFHEYPGVKTSWLRRLRFEYWELRAISASLRPHLWLAMHDMTPRVTADIQAVYCHNPAPFYKLPFRELLLDPPFTLFALFYRFLYAIGIHRNDFVIVQQSWLRDAFKARYRVRKVVVAHPSVKHLQIAEGRAESRQGTRFFYPALARSFKNIELLLAAAQLLEQRQAPPFELLLTIDGSENRYARQLRERYTHLRSVQWRGLLSRSTVLEEYAETDCLLFPSKLETWGMPLSEFRETGKPILAAALPYACETLSGYGAVHFIEPDDPAALAQAMHAFMKGTLALEGCATRKPADPHAANWEELFQILLNQ